MKKFKFSEIKKANLATLEDISAQSKIDTNELAEYVDLTKPMQVSKGSGRLTILQGEIAIKIPRFIEQLSPSYKPPKGFEDEETSLEVRRQISKIVFQMAKENEVELPTISEAMALQPGVIESVIEHIVSDSKNWEDIHHLVLPVQSVDGNGIVTQELVEPIIIQIKGTRSRYSESIMRAIESLFKLPFEYFNHSLLKDIRKNKNGGLEMPTSFGINRTGKIVMFDYGEICDLPCEGSHHYDSERHVSLTKEEKESFPSRTLENDKYFHVLCLTDVIQMYRTEFEKFLNEIGEIAKS